MLAVMLFGIYMLALLAWGVLTFRSRPDEAAALHKVACPPGQPLSSIAHTKNLLLHAVRTCSAEPHAAWL